MTWGARGLTVHRGGHLALDTVTLEVGPGEIAVVVGGDGAGKTTLCRTLVGLDPVSGGEVIRPERTGFQPETSGAWAELTVIENLEFVAGAYRLETGAARARIEELVEIAQLGEARDRLARHLSGGMRQKLGVAMAMLSAPELPVLDEPTTGLDPVSRLEIWSLLTRSAREGRALVVTTAYVDEAHRGDSVLALDEGRVLASGSVDEVVASMPGALFESERRQGIVSWRRGRTWRAWSPDGSPLPGNRVTPDLADVITVAAIAGERST